MKWLAGFVALLGSLAIHLALVLWLLSVNLAEDQPRKDEAAIAVELVKLQPPPPQTPPQPPPPKAELKESEKAKAPKKPSPRKPTRSLPPPVAAGPPAHEISANDDEWVAPRINANTAYSNAGRRAPPDYAERVKSQIIANTDYPEDAVYEVPRGHKDPPPRQQCRVEYDITVDRQGNMLKYAFDPCGIAKLDAAAEAALKKSGPFPPPPDTGAETYVIHGVQIFRVK